MRLLTRRTGFRMAARDLEKLKSAQKRNLEENTRRGLEILELFFGAFLERKRTLTDTNGRSVCTNGHSVSVR